MSTRLRYVGDFDWSSLRGFFFRFVLKSGLTKPFQLAYRRYAILALITRPCPNSSAGWPCLLVSIGGVEPEVRP